jgi:hypothetical protein
MHLDLYCPVPRRQRSVLWEHFSRRQRWIPFLFKKWVGMGVAALRRILLLVIKRVAFPPLKIRYHRFARWNDVIVGLEYESSSASHSLKDKGCAALQNLPILHFFFGFPARPLRFRLAGRSSGNVLLGPSRSLMRRIYKRVEGLQFPCRIWRGDCRCCD